MMTLKKFSATFLSLLMLLSVFPYSFTVETKAENAVNKSGKYEYRVINENEKTCELVRYSGFEENLVLPSALDGYTVTAVGESFITNSYYLTAVTVPESCKTLGKRAFYNCENLAKITFGSSIESFGGGALYGTAFYLNEKNWENGVLYCGKYLVEADRNIVGAYTVKEGTLVIGNGAFQECYSLESVKFPDSLVAVGDFSFDSCHRLKNIELPSSCKSIGFGAFGDCTDLRWVKIPASVTHIGQLSFPDRYNFEIRGYAETTAQRFSEINKIKFVEINLTVDFRLSANTPDPATVELKYNSEYTLPETLPLRDKYVFKGYTTKPSSSVAEYQPGDKVTLTEDTVFYALWEPKTTFDFDIEVLSEENKTCKITNYSGSSADLVIPDTIDGYKVTVIGKNAFSSNMALRKVTLPKYCETIEDGAFSSSSDLYEINFPTSLRKIGKEAFSHCGFKALTLPSDLTELGDGAFKNCAFLKTVSLNRNLTTLAYNAFDGCFRLENIFVNAENLAYKDLDGVLFTKDGKVLIKYPEGKGLYLYDVPDGVEIISGSAFNNAYLLEGFSLPHSVRKICEGAFYGTEFYKNRKYREDGNLYIGTFLIEAEESLAGSVRLKDGTRLIADGAFANCNALAKITVDEANPFFSTVDGVLFNKDKSSLLVYPKNKKEPLYSLPETVLTVKNGAFANCKYLETLSVPDTCEDLGEGTFSNAKALKTVYLGNGVEVLRASVFENCEALRDVILGTSVTEIEADSFKNCKALEKVVIPPFVKNIDDNVFAFCFSVTLYVTEGSYAETYAKTHNLKYVSSPREEKTVDGDIDNDGKVTLNDAMLIINDVAKKGSLTESQKTGADIDNDGKISLNDGMYIINYVAKKSDTVKPR